MCKINSKLEYAVQILPQELKDCVLSISEYDKSQIMEIRLRQGKKLTMTLKTGEYFITKSGKLSKTGTDAITVDKSHIETVFQRAFGNSVHSHHRELTEGYITISGGCRVGFCGTAVLNSDKDYRVENVKNISSINIRIAGEIQGCSDKLFQLVYSEGLKSLLISAPPISGKTTILRDLTAHLGNYYRLSLIDERNEISAVYKGVPQNEVGEFTDIFCNYNKYQGIMTAVKVMSPQIIVCDEIGSEEDLQALQYCINSGVKILATCHSESYEQLKKKAVIAKLLEQGAFDVCAVLGSGKDCGKLLQLHWTGDEKC